MMWGQSVLSAGSCDCGTGLSGAPENGVLVCSVLVLLSWERSNRQPDILG
jgi:hypothetical protein